MYTALTHTQTGFTALMFAAQEGHTDCLKVLLDAGVDKEAKTLVRQSAWTCDARLTQLAGWEHTASACCVLWPRSVCLCSAGGWRPEGGCRHGAVLRGTARVYMALTHTQTGFTAVLYAAQKGHTDCLRALLEAGADKNAANLVRSERHLFSSSQR